jgi:hypothetical protein
MRTLLAFLILFQFVWATSATAEEPVKQIEFNRDIRPILSDRCFLCHGPDQSGEQAKETDLRLDERESAIDYGIFDFANADQSELISRITSADPDLQMPPPGSHKKKLSPTQIETVKTWIQQGAKYQQHWAYLPPIRPPLPNVESGDRVYNGIDAFVISRLEEKKLRPAPTADRHALIRRVTLDLTGLPPTVAEIDAFVTDPAPLDSAYEKVVDRLLKSPHYGEQMARFWLDAARYADTNGYQYDLERSQWVWRDWVIHAFNSNMPFDQFTIEQIAGDMLPAASDQTRLATGFNRNHPITIEGGVVDEEYRTEYVIDRVVTTSTVWLGQTFLCARCHDHKYDPVSQENFYQFYSFFNNVPERGLNGFDPKITVTSPLNSSSQEIESQIADATANIAALNLPFAQWEGKLRNETAQWTAWQPDSVKSSGGATPKLLEDKSVLMTGKNPATDDYEIQFQVDQKVQSIKLEAIIDPSLTGGSASRGSNGNFVLSEFVVEAQTDSDSEFQRINISSAQADYEQKKYTIDLTYDGKVDQSGWAVDGNTKPENRTATFNLAQSIPAGAAIRIRMLHRYGASHQIGRFRFSFSEQLSSSAAIEQLLAVAADQRTADQQAELKLFLVQKFGDAQARAELQQLQHLQNQLKQVSVFPATMVMSEMPKPRQAYVLQRGEYDKPLKERPVNPAVPSALGSLPKSFPQNRLGLAQWLVAPNQPLTARVIVNRYWQRLFGVGLVKTSEDFGSQGEYPSHPELLDWLAVEFMDNGWDVKQIFKTIVMSNTYRQSSHLTAEAFALDRENRLLARGPRIRLDGEVIRDTALAVGGLLDDTVGGPSVYPYHPSGLWLEINNRPGYSRAYPHQTDPTQLHRRTLYTFWKRTVAPPSMATFDAPSREYCVVRRSSTNTPLQAFVMLHDPQFVEAARGLATRMIKEGGDDLKSRITFGFQCCTSRPPNDQELRVLLETYSDRLQDYKTDTAAADRLLSVGVTSVDTSMDRAELAAMTQVARMLMNLSEFLTKG